MRKPRLLFLCQTLPFPPDGGVSIRTYNVMRLLARQFEVTALCFYRSATRSTAEEVAASLEGLAELGSAEAFPIPQEHSRARFLRDHIRSVLSGQPYTRFVYESVAYRERVEELMASRQFDVVHVDSLDLSTYLPLTGTLPTVCAHHNVESQLLRRRADTEASPWRRWYLRHQARLIEREEARWCPRVDLNTAVSPNDRDLLSTIAPSARFTVVPNGVDTDFFEPRAVKEDGLVFVGGFSWFPNRDALAFFVEDIWPRVRERSSGVTVRWVGRAPADVQREMRQRHGLELTGYVDDIRPHVQGAAVYVVPMRVGGGTRLKILDAWAMGKAVVSTTVGCEGLAAMDGQNILVRDDPNAFAEAVVMLLRSEDVRREIGERARKTAEDVYSWDVVGEEMIPRYSALLADADPLKDAASGSGPRAQVGT